MFFEATHLYFFATYLDFCWSLTAMQLQLFPLNSRERKDTDLMFCVLLYMSLYPYVLSIYFDTGDVILKNMKSSELLHLFSIKSLT